MFGLSREEKEKELRDLEKEQAKLNDVYNSISTEAYIERVLEPIEQSIDDLAVAYDCKTLEELAYNRGKAEAYEEILNLHEKIQILKSNIEYEMDNLKQG